MIAAFSPYWDNSFWQFFATLLYRFPAILSGTWAADELQILVLSCIAISCGLLSPILVLKKMTMLANSLSHTILLGLAISYLLSRSLFGVQTFDLTHLLIGALIAGLLTALLTGGMIRLFRLQEDASVGIVFTALFALGIVFVTLFTRDVHLGIEVVMGNVDALRIEDLSLAAGLALFNGLFIILFYWPLQFATFDNAMAKALGIRCLYLEAALLFLVAASSIGAFRAVGVLLVLSFLVGPYLTARLFCHRLWQLLLLTPSIGILASIIGVALARHLLSVYGLALSTGGIVATLIALFYPIAWIIRSYQEKKWRDLTESRQKVARLSNRAI